MCNRLNNNNQLMKKNNNDQFSKYCVIRLFIARKLRSLWFVVVYIIVLTDLIWYICICQRCHRRCQQSGHQILDNLNAPLAIGAQIYKKETFLIFCFLVKAGNIYHKLLSTSLAQKAGKVSHWYTCLKLFIWNNNKVNNMYYNNIMYCNISW